MLWKKKQKVFATGRGRHQLQEILSFAPRLVLISSSSLVEPRKLQGDFGSPKNHQLVVFFYGKSSEPSTSSLDFKMLIFLLSLSLVQG